MCNDHDYCHVEMPNEDNKLLKYNHEEKSMKAPFIIYADLECLLKKMHSCQNNFQKSYTKKNKLSIRFLVIQCLQVVRLSLTKNKLGCYRDKDCMARFCKNLKEHATRIINYEKKKRNDTTDQ